MFGYIIIGITLTLPLLLGLGFRVGAPHLFFSLMAGELLARYFGHDIGRVAEPVAKSSAGNFGEMALLVTPLFLTAYVLKNSLSKGKTFLHVIPLIITGLVLEAFLLPILPTEIKEQVRSIPIGNQLLNVNRLIIGSVVALQLAALWLLNRNSGKDKDKKHKK